MCFFFLPLSLLVNVLSDLFNCGYQVYPSKLFVESIPYLAPLYYLSVCVYVTVFCVQQAAPKKLPLVGLMELFVLGDLHAVYLQVQRLRTCYLVSFLFVSLQTQFKLH